MNPRFVSFLRGIRALALRILILPRVSVAVREIERNLLRNAAPKRKPGVRDGSFVQRLRAEYTARSRLFSFSGYFTPIAVGFDKTNW